MGNAQLSWEPILVSGGAGLIAGLLIFLLGGPGPRPLAHNTATTRQPVDETDILEVRAAEMDHRNTSAIREPAPQAVDMFVERFLVIIGLILFCVPFLGAIFAVGGLVATWNIPSWTRVLARLAVVLNVAMTIFWIAQWMK
ncbi:MAG: hypothetical protein ACJ8F7_08425 [Gemmataceae bacterium]